MLVLDKKGELASHWTPITELDKFLDKVYFGSSERCSYAKTQACPYCLSIFFPSKNQATINDVKQEIKNQASDTKNHLFQHFISHLQECKCDRVTTTYFPHDDQLSFTKFKAFIDPAIR